MAGDTPKKHPTIGPQAEINNVAMALVATWFAKGWIVQSQEPNYHEDYVIEHVDGGELSGSKISAQLKGHATVKFKEGAWSEVMETKHLRYYATKVRMPVFLFVVDTTKRRGYYLFLQEWLDTNATTAQLTNQKKLSVRVPFANDIADASKFRRHVEAALAYMGKKYPGSIDDAISGETKKITEIDPRWNVKLNVVNGNKIFALSPNQDLMASLNVKGDSVGRIKELFDWGKAANLAGDDVAIHGMPLVDHLSKKTGGIASVSITNAPRQMEMHLWTGEPNGFRFTLQGAITGGQLGLSYVATLPDAPLRAELKVMREAAKAPTSEGVFSLSFDFSKWTGKPIREL